MIKILKLGDKAKREVTCNNCESILEFTMEDCTINGEDVVIKNSFDKIIKDLSYQQIILKCPCCDSEILIKNINAK